LDWAKWGFGAVGQRGLGGAGLFKDGFGDEREGAAWVKYGFDIASWVVGFVGWIAGGISMWASSEGTKKIAGWVDNGCGVVGDALRVRVRDPRCRLERERRRGEQGRRGDRLAGPHGQRRLPGRQPRRLITDEMAKEPIGLAAKVGGILTSAVTSSIGGAQLAALSVVIVASVA
jgi:hypothetical protein